jgi:leucyl-tRNA synthetase
VIRFSTIQDKELKWQRRWSDSHLFEADPNKLKPKFFILFAYPTASGALHVGHARSYAIPDVIARYRRMQGFNVLFPLGFHATGIDCINIHENIMEDLMSGEKYGIPLEDARDIKSPIDLERYLERTITRSLRRLGLSLNLCSRTSTIDYSYNRFIQWQFRKLYDAGYLVQRNYRLPWCPRCDHPVSLDAAEADISDWKRATIKEYTVIKFRDRKGRIFPASTLRPETVYGTTNLWLDPDGCYVRARVDEEAWITSVDSCKKLSDQGKKVVVLEELDTAALGTDVINPMTGDSVPVLTAGFIDADEATGVVMSVPAHDPYDYLHVKQRYPQLKPIRVIEVEGMGVVPSEKVIEELGIGGIADSRLDEAVKKLYQREKTGRLVSSIRELGGMATTEAREATRRLLMEREALDVFYEFSVKPIFCRCGAEIVIKVIEGQWFINYADPAWKRRAKRCVEGMKIFPPDYKRDLPDVIDWLAERPCARRRGLGTPFPFEEEWIIEALSDSTIYMAFFLVSKFLNEGLIREDQLTDSFFDYVFLNRMPIDEVIRETGVPEELLREIRGEFDYWYPLDLNAGGKEHKTVHFPFFVFNHVAIFPERYWPKGIFVNWHLISYGQKMSKHLGNVVYLDVALEKWGADAIRFYLLHGSNQWRDFDWRGEECEVYQRHLTRFRNMIAELIDHDENELKPTVMDAWLKTAFNLRINGVTNALENGEIRRAIDTAFFGVWNDIAWHRKRTGSTRLDVGLIESWVKILAPFIPHTCEEVWARMGEESFISNSTWPEIEEEGIDEELMDLEQILQKTMGDLKHISEIIGHREKLFIYTVSEGEYEHFTIAREFLKDEFRFEIVEVYRTSDKDRYDPEDRARKAELGKPGIFLE